MSRKKADWIDKRLRHTTNLGEASALVANDIAANLPSDDKLMIVIEVSGSRVWDVYSNRPLAAKVILVDYDDAELNPGDGVKVMDIDAISNLSKEAKVLMFDAGISVGAPP